MQLIDLSLSHLNFYCPATGQLICNENDGANYEADSLMGYWSSYSLQEPFIKNEWLKKEWEAFVIKTSTGSFNWEDIEIWLKELDKRNWVVFAISDQGNSIGTSFTTWWVIDMDTFTEEEDEDIDLFDNVEDNPV